MTTWYEVRREATEEELAGYANSGYVIETFRVDKKAAELDVDLFAMLGRKAWIVEVER